MKQAEDGLSRRETTCKDCTDINEELLAAIIGLNDDKIDVTQVSLCTVRNICINQEQDRRIIFPREQTLSQQDNSKKDSLPTPVEFIADRV